MCKFLLFFLFMSWNYEFLFLFNISTNDLEDAEQYTFPRFADDTKFGGRAVTVRSLDRQVRGNGPAGTSWNLVRANACTWEGETPGNNAGWDRLAGEQLCRKGFGTLVGQWAEREPALYCDRENRQQQPGLSWKEQSHQTGGSGYPLYLTFVQSHLEYCLHPGIQYLKRILSLYVQNLSVLMTTTTILFLLLGHGDNCNRWYYVYRFSLCFYKAPSLLGPTVLFGVNLPYTDRIIWEI